MMEGIQIIKPICFEHSPIISFVFESISVCREMKKWRKIRKKITRVKVENQNKSRTFFHIDRFLFTHLLLIQTKRIDIDNFIGWISFTVLATNFLPNVIWLRLREVNIDSDILNLIWFWCRKSFCSENKILAPQTFSWIVFWIHSDCFFNSIWTFLFDGICRIVKKISIENRTMFSHCYSRLFSITTIWSLSLYHSVLDLSCGFRIFHEIIWKLCRWQNNFRPYSAMYLSFCSKFRIDLVRSNRETNSNSIAINLYLTSLHKFVFLSISVFLIVSV